MDDVNGGIEEVGVEEVGVDIRESREFVALFVTVVIVNEILDRV